MSIQPTTESNVFLKKTETLYIDENSVTEYSKSMKVETLIKELREKGPLIALGKVGPECYVGEPKKYKAEFIQQDVYGWPQSTKRTGRSCYVMVLGASKGKLGEHVYFTIPKDITPVKTNFIRGYKSSKLHQRIYVSSHKTFLNYLNDLYPPLSSKMKGYLDALAAFPLNSILDRGEVEKKCHDIGQKIFDDYKKKQNGDSFEGKKAVQDICDTLRTYSDDGNLRKQYVERAWAYIGDKNWKWYP